MKNKNLSRRDFAKRSLIGLAGLGSFTLLGYFLSDRETIRGLHNALTIGHCAPSVMKTLVDENSIQNENLVLYSGAMAGGIAGPGMECGGLTAPLMFMSSQNNDYSFTGQLNLLHTSQLYVKEFAGYYGSIICEKIRAKGNSACRKVMCSFHKPLSNAMLIRTELPSEVKLSYLQLLQVFEDKKFHCATNVLNKLNSPVFKNKELFGSAWIFIGGIALLNQTCGALAAGVLALGALTARKEDSYTRVAKMNWLLKHNRIKEAMSEELNNFNHSILLSEELGIWFHNEFGSTSCFGIWGYDFSKTKESESYLSGFCMDHCKKIAEMVSRKVIQMI